MFSQPLSWRLPLWIRLTGLILLLGFGLLTEGALTARSAHAQPATTTTVTNCSNDSQLQADVANAASGDTISFGCSGTITLTQTVTISKNLTLDGSGQSVTLDGNNSTRVLSVNSGINFTLNALTVAHGSPNGTPDFNGGGLENEGGTVTISNSSFTNNSAGNQVADPNDPVTGFGAGLYSTGGTIIISNSSFTNNSAFSSKNPNMGFGGGLYSAGGTVTISNSSFASNLVGSTGGGLFNATGSTVTISTSTFAHNTPNGIRNVGAAMIDTSTFDFNVGSGIANDETMTINTSTVIGNGGEGIVNNHNFLNNGTKLTISNSTIAGNRTSGIQGESVDDTLTIRESIVANNPSGNCGRPIRIIDGGYNLSSDSSCPNFDPSTSDLENTDPKLASALTNNGGPTQTLALQQDSPAIDQIPAAQCPATDQRGVSRRDNGESTCDIGAYESSYAQDPDHDLALTNIPSNMTVNATSLQGAAVTYTLPTEVDESGDNPGPSVSCSPASGSTFAPLTTTVTCTATDNDDTNLVPVTGSFTVTVVFAPPTLQLPSSPLTVDATSPQGAVVNYTVTASDPVFPTNQLTIRCTPASGSTFAIGSTTVDCLAINPATFTKGSFTVTVVDKLPPSLHLPSSPLTVDATSPQGAVVNYTVTASDPVYPANQLTISCTPASGSTFAIGDTTVNCTVSDPAGNSASGSFTVHVNGTATQISNLITLVNSFHLQKGIQTSLDLELQVAQAALAHNQPKLACLALKVFSVEVTKLTGHGITASQAGQLLTAAKQIQAVIGC